MAFLHVEGPHLSAEDGYRGAHPAGQIRPPDIDEFDALAEAAGGLLGLVTVSPHYPEAAAYTAHAVAGGVRVAIGHTHARAPEIAAAVAAGAAFSTHLGNGCAAHAAPARQPPLAAARRRRGSPPASSPMASTSPTRRSPRCWRPRATTAIWCPTPSRWRAARRATTTAPSAARVTLSPEGRLSMAGTSMLAGAACPLSRGVATLARLDGGSLARGVSLAAERPRRIAGWSPGFTGG